MTPNLCPPRPESACTLPPSVTFRQQAGAAELVTLVDAARAGDHTAWSSLVRRFDPLLRGIAKTYRLSPADVDDVVQTSWLSLLKDIESLREPAAVGAWLAMTTRRNALRLLGRYAREQLVDDAWLSEHADTSNPELEMLAAERREALVQAVAMLPERHRELMTVLIALPNLDYRSVGELLSMPVGSIGPTRARSLARLSHNAQLRALRDPSCTVS